MSRGVEYAEEGEMGWIRVSSLLFSFHSMPQRAADAFKGRLKCRDSWQFVYQPAFSFLLCSHFPFFFFHLLLLFLHPCLLLRVYGFTTNLYYEPIESNRMLSSEKNFQNFVFKKLNTII